LWLIVLEDVSSRAVLSQHLCLGEEPTGEDVLEAIRLALTPWEPRKLIAPNMRYSPNACFPSSFDPRFLGAKWEQFSVDGALANISEIVRKPMKQLLGIEPIVLPRRNKDDRPFVERFFQTLEESGCHRLPNTTGNGPGDTRRDNPEMAAIKYTIQMEYLEDISDVIIANYNGAPHSYHGQPPVEYLEFTCASSGKWPELIDQRDAEMLLCYRETVVVRGSIKDSRRPYVHWHGVNYSNDVLKNSYALVGKKLTLLIHRRDLRTIRAFRDNGAELGVLRAATPWDRMPHTLDMRRAFFSLRRDRRFRYNTDPDHCDPIFALLEHLEATALKKKIVPPLYLEVRSLLTQHLEEFRDQVNSRSAGNADNNGEHQNNNSKKLTNESSQQQCAPLECVKAVNW
jgi:transposase InsO family protein